MRHHDLTSPRPPSVIANYQAAARRIGLFKPAAADTNLNSMPHIVDVDCPAGCNLKRPSRFRDDFLKRVRWCQQYGVGGWAVEPVVQGRRVAAYRFRFGNVHIATCFRLRFEADRPQRCERQD
jgi:hypothetical protein